MNPEINNSSPTNPTPTQVVESPKKCKHMPIIIVLAILAVAGLGFGGFELWQNMQKDNDIKNLQAESMKAEEHKEEKQCDNTSTLNIVDINKDEKVKYHYYASPTTKYGRYSLVLTYIDDSKGFFELINSGKLYSDSFGGYFDIKGNNIILSKGPFVEGNDFRAAENILLEMGVTLEPSNDLQENYKGYKTVVKDGTLKLGDVSFQKVN